MNAYRFNGIIGHYARKAIIDGLDIPLCMIYKKVMNIIEDGIIITDDGKKYKLTLTKIKDDEKINQ